MQLSQAILGNYLRLSLAIILDYFRQLCLTILGIYLRLAQATILDYLRQLSQAILGNYLKLSQPKTTVLDYLRQLPQSILKGVSSGKFFLVGKVILCCGKTMVSFDAGKLIDRKFKENQCLRQGLGGPQDPLAGKKISLQTPFKLP